MTDKRPTKDPRRRGEGGDRPAPSRVRVLVVCDDERRLRDVVGRIGQLRAGVVTVPWYEYVDKLGAAFDAVVLAEPLPVASSAAVAAVRGHPHGGSLPLYVITGDRASASRVRGIYASGATAVFNWPREARLLPDLLAETFGMAGVRGRAEKPDVALARTIRAHLRLGPNPGSAIRLKARGGTVSISGETRFLSHKRKITETIAAVPGVTRILADSLRVGHQGISDRTVEDDIRTVARRMSEIDPTALSVHVSNGRVRIEGSVSSRAQFLHLIELIENVRGVRELDYFVDVSEERPATDPRIRRRLTRGLAQLFPQEAVELSVFDGVAVLAGSVRSLAVKRQIERVVARDDAVARVVNKLQVSRH